MKLPAVEVEKRSLAIWLDDEREAPDGWHRVYWPNEVIDLIKSGEASEVSLDHDLGDDVRGTGYDVITWIEEACALNPDFMPPRLFIHSANSSAAEKMRMGIESIARIVASRKKHPPEWLSVSPYDPRAVAAMPEPVGVPAVSAAPEWHCEQPALGAETLEHALPDWQTAIFKGALAALIDNFSKEIPGQAVALNLSILNGKCSIVVEQAGPKIFSKRSKEFKLARYERAINAVSRPWETISEPVGSKSLEGQTSFFETGKEPAS